MFKKCVRWLSRSTEKYTYIWLILITLSCFLSSFFLADLRLDTNLIRLLPENSALFQWTNKLRGPIGDGGYFTILIESNDREKLLEAADYIHKETEKLHEIYFANYRNPIQFIEKYKYLLLPLPLLERLYDYALRLEAETNPFTTDLMGGHGEPADSRIEQSKRRSIEKKLGQFSSLREYNENPDGNLMGIIAYPRSMITELEDIRKLYNRIDKISLEAAEKYNVWSQVGGSQIKNLREYKSIIEDLGRAGLVSLAAILGILFFSFRSLRVLPVVILPLLVGLVWAFSLVPVLIGSLNIITVFLLLILFGMGIDYSIHLIRQFQKQIQILSVGEALYETFSVTGKSVAISGLTTALPLFVLALSRFRGFSDFGMIGGLSIIMMLIAMFTVLPTFLLIAYRLNFITSSVTLTGSFPPLGKKSAVALLVFIVFSSFFALKSGNLFDYNFSAHTNDIQSVQKFEKRHKKVFNQSMVPAALYLAPDIGNLDRSLAALTNALEREESTIERVTSIRDFAPEKEEFDRRIELISQTKEIFKGSWYKHISDPDIKKWVTDLRSWTPPEKPSDIFSLPKEILAYYLSRDGSNQFLIGIYPAVSRRNGHEVLAFQKELEQAVLPGKLQGPIGEGIVFAEILGLVLHEAPIVFFFALLAVALPIYLSNRSFKETALTLFPLISGMALMFGIMGISGMQVNYLSIVIIPALLGMGVDDGIHYFRHCKSHNYDILTTQKELFGTLSICTLTTMIGYFGLVMAHNRGLQSLGLLACLGMTCLWVTSMFLLPAFLGEKSN